MDQPLPPPEIIEPKDGDDCCNGTMYCTLPLGISCKGPDLAPGEQVVLSLDTIAGVDSAESACGTNDNGAHILSIYVWIAQPEGALKPVVDADGDVTVPPDPHLFFARGLVPMVTNTVRNLLPSYFPPLYEPPWTIVPDLVWISWTDGAHAKGTFADTAGWLLQRSWRLVRVPHDRVDSYAETLSSSTIELRWQIVVANMLSWLDATKQASLTNYTVLAECSPSPDLVTCPSVDPPGPEGTVQECSGYGACVRFNGTKRGGVGSTRLCECNATRAGLACEHEAQVLAFPSLSAASEQQAESETGTWPVPVIATGAWEPLPPLPKAQWVYYTLKVPRSAPGIELAEVMVELNSTDGQPLLFLKPMDQGYVPFDVPSLQDASTFSSATSFLEARTLLAVSLLRTDATNATDAVDKGPWPDPAPMLREDGNVTLLYAAVYCTDDALASRDCLGSIRVRARAQSAADPAAYICPLDCNGMGTCEPEPLTTATSDADFDAEAASHWAPTESTATCLCNQNASAAGPYCQFTVSTILGVGDMTPWTERDVLYEGEWAYVRSEKNISLSGGDGGSPRVLTIEIELGERTGAGKELENDAHVLIVANLDRDLPGLQDNEYDFVLHSGVATQGKIESTIVVDDQDAQAGNLTIGVLNMGLLGRGPLTFRLRVIYGESSSGRSVGFIVGVTIGCVVFMLLLVYVCLRIIVQLRTPLAPPEIELLAMQPQGLTGAEIAELRSFVVEDMEHYGVTNRQLVQSTPVPAGAGPPDAGVVPQCSVCCEEYEPKDVLRKLPCDHVFHQACIDLWLLRNASCPICRNLVLPPSRLAAMDRRNSSQANGHLSGGSGMLSRSSLPPPGPRLPPVGGPWGTRADEVPSPRQVLPSARPSNALSNTQHPAEPSEGSSAHVDDPWLSAEARDSLTGASPRSSYDSEEDYAARYGHHPPLDAQYSSRSYGTPQSDSRHFVASEHSAGAAAAAAHARDLQQQQSRQRSAIGSEASVGWSVSHTEQLLSRIPRHSEGLAEQRSRGVSDRAHSKRSDSFAAPASVSSGRVMESMSPRGGYGLHDAPSTSRSQREFLTATRSGTHPGPLSPRLQEEDQAVPTRSPMQSSGAWSHGDGPVGRNSGRSHSDYESAQHASISSADRTRSGVAGPAGEW